MSAITWTPILKRGDIPRSFTHLAIIERVTVYKSKTRVRVNLEACIMIATPKPGQSLDDAARIIARRASSDRQGT